MSDLQLGPVIGKIGGASVESIPIDFVSPSGKGTYDVMTVPVPAGKRCRMMVTINSPINNTNMGSYPELIIGGENMGKFFDGACGASKIVTGPALIQVRRVSSSATFDPSFTGTAYWWEESD